MSETDEQDGSDKLHARWYVVTTGGVYNQGTRQQGRYKAHITLDGKPMWFEGRYDIGPDALVSETIQLHLVDRFVGCMVYERTND